MAWASPVIDRTATMTQRAASGDDYNYFLAKNGIALACGDGTIVVLYYVDYPKGFYNAGDMNRVEANTAEIAALLNANGYPVTIIPHHVDARSYTVELENGTTQAVTIPEHTEWILSDIPTDTEAARYLHNIQACISAFCVRPTTPSMPANLAGLTYITANNIEQIQADIYELIHNMTASLQYCGDAVCGG